MSESGFQPTGEGRYQVKGALSFETVAQIWAQSRDGLGAAANISIDFAQVSEVDSAGLALVLEWLRWARLQQRRLTINHVPAKLMALAQMSEVDKLLSRVTRET